MSETNGRKETGMILQQLKDLNSNFYEFKGDTKTSLEKIKTSMDEIKEDTILQREKIRTIEILASNNKKKIGLVKDSVWNIKIQMAGIATGITSFLLIAKELIISLNIFK